MIAWIRARWLVIEIALAGLLQFTVVVLAMWLLVWALGLPPFVLQNCRYKAAVLHDASERPGGLEHELSRLRAQVGMTATIYSPEGRVVRSSNDPPLEGNTIGVPYGDDGSRIEFILPPTPDSLFHSRVAILAVLGVVSLASVLLWRSISRPLVQIKRAAQSFGAGDLSARASIRRRDEIGALGNSFNEMAERLSGMIRSQKELLANVSHELRTPLARIRVAIDLAEEGDAEEARSSLKEISSDLMELERIIADVLTTTRLEMVQQRAGPATFVLRMETVEVADLLERAKGRQPEGRVLLQVGPGLPEFEADPVLLRRVIDNLIANAIHHSEAEHPVELSARLEGPRIVIEVRDRGVGIAPEDLAKLMTPFARTDRSRSRITGGLGLGLALAKGIVEAHGGTLELLSTVGKGTTARVWLPVPVGST